MSNIFQQFTFLLVLSFLNLGSGQFCIFRPIENGYSCELAFGTYLNRGDPFIIAGGHLPGFNDQNVTVMTKSLEYPPDLRLIPETVFQRFPNLRTLDFSNGNVESLAGIPNCAALETFIINDNNLVDPSGLSQCTNLRYISMNSNRITNINSADFQNLNQLSDLIVVNNFISRISALNLPSLQTLNVGLNRLNAIPRNFFASLPELITFNAVGNICVDRILNPQTDPDLNQALEPCFQNYDGVTDPPPTTILPETPTPPIIDPETTEPATTPVPETPAPPTDAPTTVPPTTAAPTTQPPTTDAPTTTPASGSLLESKIQLTFVLFLLVLVLSKVNLI